MRFLALIIVSLFLLIGCGTPPQAFDATADDKKPRIPNVKASILDADTTNLEVDEMEQLLEEIDKELNAPNITEEDIRRGWYYGSQEDKKYGTPSSWIWVASSDEPRWASPNILEESDYLEAKNLCEQTAGVYSISCLDTEMLDCEYVAKSECRCSYDTEWQDEQGCILVDEEDEFISISQDELRRGWYIGLPSEKKLNTPSSWIWVEGGQNSRWQNSSSQ